MKVRARLPLLVALSILITTGSALATTVYINSPLNGQTVGSPAHVVGSATSASGIKAIQVYVDSTLVSQVYAAAIDTYVPIAAGGHLVTVQAWDGTGAVTKNAVTVNVSGGSAPAAVPGGAATIGNIDQMAGWQACNSCAGAGGAGAAVPFSMSHSGNPSIDGNSALFWIGGATPYSAALWWKQLGGRNTTHHIYDLYFYMANPAASQALEFDVNQSIDGRKYIFGTECNYRGTRTWDVWNGYTWVSTGIGCSIPSAYTWHHLTEEFYRTSNGYVQFVSITVDGQKAYVNRYYPSKAVNANELNVAFQMDTNYASTNYITWVDKITLSTW